MTYETDSLDSQLIEAKGTEDRTVRPVPPEHLPRLLKLRQQLIDAGRMSPDEAALSENHASDQEK